nr:MAG TPA: C2H2 type zinc-finger protein [Caudoviricetes sp.]
MIKIDLLDRTLVSTCGMIYAEKYVNEAVAHRGGFFLWWKI